MKRKVQLLKMGNIELKKLAVKASENAYVPYSKFPVGAALRTAEGKIFTGCNVENISYGLANCAERTAIFKAVSEGYKDFSEIAIYGNTEEPISPCGACRQVMLETEKRFKQPMRILLFGKKGIYEMKSVGALLPLSFDASSME